jgi:hypothetical protein
LQKNQVYGISYFIYNPVKEIFISSIENIRNVRIINQIVSLSRNIYNKKKQREQIFLNIICHDLMTQQQKIVGVIFLAYHD